MTKGSWGASKRSLGQVDHITHDWLTPCEYIPYIDALLKNIDLDPCSTYDANNQFLRAEKIYTHEIDGLNIEEPWTGKTYLFPPTFGLNFVNDIKYKNKKFMLLCGFEKFDNFFVRIDILERLFVLIINSSSKENSEIKLVPEMLNLLGCSKDNFKKLLQKMNYKIFEKENETFFKYSPTKKFKKITTKKISNENPFKILKNLNLN